MVRYEKFDEPPDHGGASLNQVFSDSQEVSSPSEREEPCDDDALQRASNFFSSELDESQTIEEPASLSTSTLEDPSLLLRWRIRRCIESLPCRLLIAILILVDLSIIIWGVAAPPTSVALASVLSALDMSISLVFVMEVSLRLFALGLKEFIRKWYHVLDALVVYTTASISICDLLLETTLPIKSLRLIAILRLMRVVRLVRICTEKKNLEMGVRQLVSQNKRRFQQDGFDLDLTYVTDRVIAMSYPSTGRMALYRNPAREVARFLEFKHPGAYKVYNLCSERSYDTALFNHRVERYMIEDHNVPSLREMIEFSQSMRQWLEESPDNVAVVHCKGGKGRTGTMVCVWLVESGHFRSARDSLGYFGQRRTDLRVGHTFQGVETPSQSRYVAYFDHVKQLGYDSLTEPPLLLQEFTLRGLARLGRGNGSDLSLQLLPRSKISTPTFTPFIAHFGKMTNCLVEHKSEEDELKVHLLNCPVLNADVKLVVKCDTNSAPRGYDNSAFYLWFHTGFIENNKLTLCREELDNPHKPKTWHVFGPDFGVELLFRPVKSAAGASQMC